MRRTRRPSVRESAIGLLAVMTVGVAAFMPSRAAAAVQCWGPYATYDQARFALQEALAQGYCVDPNLDPQQAYFEIVGGADANGNNVYWGCCNTYTSKLPEPAEPKQEHDEQAEE